MAEIDPAVQAERDRCKAHVLELASHFAGFPSVRDPILGTVTAIESGEAAPPEYSREGMGDGRD